jgi:hypothetical protein
VTHGPFEKYPASNSEKNYALRPHAVSHMLAEGFSERCIQIEWVDIVTAYIPRRPFWQTPYIRGKRKK